MKVFSKSIYEKRLERFREKLRGKNIDAALVTKRENYIYMSGFTGTSAVLLITEKDAVLVTDFRYVEQASLQAQLYEVVKYKGSLLVAIGELVRSRKVERLGFEEAYATYGAYCEYKKLNLKELVPLGGIVENLRIAKDGEEIDTIKRAVKIADDAFDHVIKFIKPGAAEVEIAAEIEYYMKKKGATGASFETIVASGARSSMPHGVASEKLIQAGDPVTLDYGALYKNYCSDMTRTVFVGDPDAELLNIYRIVLEAQLKSLTAAREGVTGREVDLTARELIAAAGYGDNFGHGLGHGVGLEIHEEPRFSPSGNIVMENGMVVTVEPGIYVTGLGGVRIEDMIIINGDRPVILTESPKDLIII